MNNLINIQKDRNGQNIVWARELHHFLESNQQFTDWIKNRIEKYELTENQDYCLLHKIMKQNGRGGHNKTEYALTLDCAKELAIFSKLQFCSLANYQITTTQNYQYGNANI